MGKPATVSFRRAGTPAPRSYVPFTHRWYGKLILLLLSVALLSLAFAPFKQFYLAWVGLVPWLVVVRNSRTAWRAFGWSWVGGLFFFTANMWWLASVTGPGLIALMMLLGLYWAVAGLVIKGAGLLPGGRQWRSGGVTELRSEKKEKEKKQPGTAATPPLHHSTTPPLLAVPAIAAVWVGLEWFRGTWPFNGLPWLYMGHTQTPALYLCQVADVAGELGVSFWVVMVNAWVALLLMTGLSFRRVALAGVMVWVVLMGVAGYGGWRFAQESAVTSPGPTVMVVQSNIPQSNSGEKGAPLEDIVIFHGEETAKALNARAKNSPARDPGVDLVVWSETMMPPLNRSARLMLGSEPKWGLLKESHRLLSDLAVRYRTHFLVGGMYWDDFPITNGEVSLPAKDSRNVAYYYDRNGAPAAEYHKVHLVPFGEYIPFKEALPPLYRLMCSLGPPHMEDYQLHPGDERNLTVFPLTVDPAAAGAATVPSAGQPPRTYRFVTPICFEDIDGSLVARMFRSPPRAGGAGGTTQTLAGESAAEGRGAEARPAGKSADFIVNITNDGWFKFSEMPQHLQAAQFRSIENRAPTARSVNTGISGFIDSMGRTHDLIPAGTAGTAVAALRVDSRATPFTAWGNAFAQACAAGTGLMAVAGLVRWWRRRGRNAE